MEGPKMYTEYTDADLGAAFEQVQKRGRRRARRRRPPEEASRPRRRAAVRARERRDRSGRSSARSGDSGSDSDAEPPTDLWRWASERSWRNLVASVESRDFEHELYVERMQGWPR